jgi:hypothetical protein
VALNLLETPKGKNWDPKQITGRQQNPRGAAKQALDLAASWAVDINHGQNEGQQNRGQHPTGRKSPNGAQTATQSDMGADLGESPGQQANEVEAFD